MLIPLYNEEEFINILLARVLAAPLPEGMDRELVIVNDCSKDGSAEMVEKFIADHPENRIRLIHHDVNQGKGAAIRTAIEHAEGEFSIIQDADLEYDPNEYSKIVMPLIRGDADVVYGSRFVMSEERRVLYFWHSLANQMLTLLCNFVSDLNLTDMETCYKAFRTSLLKTIPIRSNRFGIEPEVTIKLARRRARIYEVAISYHGRTYEEGKKIGLKDAFDALYVILKSRLTNDIYFGAGPAILEALAQAPKFNRWMADTISDFIGNRVLEIGAGTGNMTRHLCPRRELYVATDLEHEHLERLKNGFRHRPTLHVRKLDAADPADFEPFHNTFDTVVLLNVLEHVEDDANALDNIKTALQTGGRLVVLVPQGPEAYGALDKSLGHFRRYTKESLTSLLQSRGFTVERTIPFNHVSYPGWRVAGQVLQAKTLSPFSMGLFDKLVWLWRKIDNSLPWGPTSVIAIAVKK